MRAKDALGRYGEDLAARHLESLGLTVLARNWRCDLGELDIIATDGPCLVVCEVKTRRDERFGAPVEAVSPRKVRRLRRLVLRWLEDQGVYAPRMRFDVIGIVQPRAGGPRLTHLVGVDVT
jgi:putative endonuclease